jgi:hypothetical protein
MAGNAQSVQGASPDHPVGLERRGALERANRVGGMRTEAPIDRADGVSRAREPVLNLADPRRAGRTHEARSDPDRTGRPIGPANGAS